MAPERGSTWLHGNRGRPDNLDNSPGPDIERIGPWPLKRVGDNPGVWGDRSSIESPISAPVSG